MVMPTAVARVGSPQESHPAKYDTRAKATKTIPRIRRDAVRPRSRRGRLAVFVAHTFSAASTHS